MSQNALMNQATEVGFLFRCQ